MEITPIAHIRSDFKEKFGIPRQSGLVAEIRAEVIFEPPYRIAEAVRGLEGFTHIWLIWEFSQARRAGWTPTVRPPRLGGNKRLGVFATRSPFRPNSLGLSAVKLEKIEHHPQSGPILHIAGSDLLDGTPIYDIKPYIPYADAHPDASGGFTDQTGHRRLEVKCEAELLAKLPPEKREALIGVLAEDPRPSYQTDPNRVYGMLFSDVNVHFTVSGEILTVESIEKNE